MTPVSATAMRDELEKIALLERLVRLGATDVPGTPRMVMRKRSPQELKGLQQGVERWWDKKVTEPIMSVAERGLKKLPEGRVQETARGVAKLVAADPVGGSLTAFAPGGLLVPPVKKGLEKLIDVAAPLPK